MCSLRYIPERASRVVLISAPGPTTLANVCGACGVKTVTPSALLSTGALDGMPIQIEDEDRYRWADGGVDGGGELTILLRTSNLADTKTFREIEDAICYSTNNTKVETFPADMIMLPWQGHVSLLTMCKKIQAKLDGKFW